MKTARFMVGERPNQIIQRSIIECKNLTPLLILHHIDGLNISKISESRSENIWSAFVVI